MENELKDSFTEDVKWFKQRFTEIKTIQRNEKKGEIFTTVILKNGDVGVVKAQVVDNVELGILWAYTKAKEVSQKRYKGVAKEIREAAEAMALPSRLKFKTLSNPLPTQSRCSVEIVNLEIPSFPNYMKKYIQESLDNQGQQMRQKARDVNSVDYYSKKYGKHHSEMMSHLLGVLPKP